VFDMRFGMFLVCFGMCLACFWFVFGMFLWYVLYIILGGCLSMKSKHLISFHSITYCFLYSYDVLSPANHPLRVQVKYYYNYH
jgi:hypothetical protein